MNKTLKVAFADMWYPWESEDFITPILKQEYNVILDAKNPDVVFHSVFNGLKETQEYNCKKILITAENHRHWNFKSDYFISFDEHTNKNFRLPLWQIFCLLDNTLLERLFNRKHHDNFSKFAAFTVSNPSNLLRNSHFDKLHAYKPVSSYGKVRTNSFKLQQLSAGKYWRHAKDQFFLENPHKFMMAYENTSYPYYCTEKLMDAFLVGSIPIYWGDPKVNEDWNEKAFINAMHPNWLDRVQHLDQNKEEFTYMYHQPVFTDEQKQKHLNNIEEFKKWLLKIVKNG